MDTAHHDVPGSRRAETNDWGNMINATAYMIPPIIEKMDTASLDIRNGGRAQIHMNTHNKDNSDDDFSDDNPNPKKRGFQHVYKSKTNSSHRVMVAHEVSMTEGTPNSKLGKRRDNKKSKKIASLQEVLPSNVHVMGRSFLSTRPVFYSGTPRRSLPNAIDNGIMLSAMEDLKVIDTIFGARMESAAGDTVFTLIPRHDAIHKMTHVKKTIASLYALDDAKRAAEVRGKTRMTVAEDNGKYVTVGLKPNRGSVGVSEIWPQKLSIADRNSIRKLMARCEEAAKGYIPSNELRGLRIAQVLGEWKEISGVSSNPIWGSLACGRNYYLNSHVDEDFFYSLTTVTSEHGLQQDIDRYSMDADVSNYFTFAEQGIAVALRPGDMLIFNPLYHHCLSSRTSAFQSMDVFCLSLYLKTAVVGKNDNSLN